MPREVRDQVYKLLLCNPLLVTPHSVTNGSNRGANLDYELNVQLLRVCRKFHEEASHTLYTENTFYNYCEPSSDAPGSPSWNQHNVSPLTRYYQSQHLPINSTLPSITELSAFRFAKCWNVVYNTIDVYDGMPGSASYSSVEFCRAVCGNNLLKLDLLLVHTMWEAGSHINGYKSVDAILPAGKLVRCTAGNFGMLEADIIDHMPDFFNQDEYFTQLGYANQNWSSIMESAVFDSVESKIPAEPVFKMYSPLLRHAQTFEVFGPWKREMSFEEYEEHVETYLESEFQDYFESGQTNPYRIEEMHPVEATLIMAKLACQNDDTAAFKEARLRVCTIWRTSTSELLMLPIVSIGL
jgi:hypothetical protein